MKNKWYLSVIAFLSILVIVLTSSLYRSNKKLKNEKSSCAKEMFDLATESPEVSLRLYQLMKDVDMVFRKHNIEYWADGGTILGAVRHGGIIPYDDDLDIEIDSKDIVRLEPVLIDLEKLGYKISKNRTDWVQVFSYDKCSNRENHIDILSITFNGQHATFTNNDAVKLFGMKRTFNKSEIFPIKQYKFGDIFISGPSEPISYLEGYYSKDVLQKGCIWPKHSNPSIKQGRCLNLEGEMLEPLKPTGPLIDNSKIDQN